MSNRGLLKSLTQKLTQGSDASSDSMSTEDIKSIVEVKDVLELGSVLWCGNRRSALEYTVVEGQLTIGSEDGDNTDSNSSG